jgi:hypothetical protein
MEIPKETVQQLKTEHPGVQLYRVTNSKLEFILRPPTEAEFKRWQDTNKNDPLAGDRLVTDCVLYPSADDFKGLVSLKPALVASLGEKVLEIAGFDQNARVEEL